MKCKLCASDNLSVTMHLDRVPRNVQFLLDEPRDDNKFLVDLDFYQCADCGLVQLPQQLGDDYYNDYLMTTSFSPQIHTYQKELIKLLSQYCDLTSANIIDIGCGDGVFMKEFVEQNYKISGVEPSDVSRKIAQAAGLNVTGGYITKDTVLPSAPYDVFVSRQVFEHIPDIKDFLSGIRSNLSDNAIGLIEVPSLEKAQKDLRFYDFFPDHVNYFSLRTLRLALEVNGFEVLHLSHSMYDEYNLAIVRKLPVVGCDKIKQSIDLLTAEVEQWLHDQKQKGNTTVIWGSGAKGISILCNISTDSVDYIVDSDINKQGKYIPVCNKLIESPDVISADNVSILVTAVAYQNIILQKLEQDYNFTGPLAILGTPLDVINE